MEILWVSHSGFWINKSVKYTVCTIFFFLHLSVLLTVVILLILYLTSGNEIGKHRAGPEGYDEWRSSYHI